MLVGDDRRMVGSVRSRIVGWIALTMVASACTATAESAGAERYPADRRCVNERFDEAGLLYPASDAYVDTRLTDWPTATPESVGLDAALLDRAIVEVSRAPRVTSLLIARHGRLVVEEYFNGARPSDARNPHSATKSLIALLVGIAIADGHLDGLDIPIGEVIPDVVAGSPVADVTVEQVLSMSSGLDWDDNVTPFEDTTMIEAVLHADRLAQSGTVWNYNSGGSDLLALALDRVVPGGLCRYAHARLFTPLGIDVDHWHENPEGSVTGGNSAFLTPRELARIGQLVLDGGSWQGRQLVSPEWIETMVDPRFELPLPRLSRLGVEVSYALHWWINDLDSTRIWNASGYGGQDIRVIPSLDLVVVITHDTSGLVDRQVPAADLNQLFVFPAAGDTIDECPCPPDLFLAHPDGSGRVALAPHPGNDLAADWSPDGTQIVFHSFRDLNAELYVMQADGSDLHRLTFDWAVDAGPKWSPDGTRLAFMSDRSAADLLSDPQFDVQVIDLTTGAIERLTETGDVRALDWSPGGDRIAFVRGSGFDGLGELWAVDVTTGATELLLSGPVGFPAWSPDGSKIAVGIRGDRIGTLQVASGILVDFGPGMLPAWSADGSQLLVTVDGTTLVAIDVVDGARSAIGQFAYGTPSPDGEWILFTDSPR
jgi:CubicO group peptidase (beta-lactamase class C family)